MGTAPSAPFPAAPASPQDLRYVAWFHELDAWTEYWDVYHPETKGRFYFGDGEGETGLLGAFLPRTGYPPPWTAWSRWALKAAPAEDFRAEVRKREVADAVMEVDALVGGLFAKHFGDAAEPAVREDYLEATFRFALDVLPAATEREARIAEDDWRKRTAGRHTLDGDLMWFAWALHTEAVEALVGRGRDRAGHARRALTLAGIAAGCPANFAWRGHRRTRAEYRPDEETLARLRARSLDWALDYEGAAAEVHALYRIREWGEEEA
ncbi:hypothetical protein [Phenylobacterium sp.]|uniref:hypothetical protein n=1 Tax=Phenylobacterium sp. TaxID=1871053 RepID=UPI0035662753